MTSIFVSHSGEICFLVLNKYLHIFVRLAYAPIMPMPPLPPLLRRRPLLGLLKSGMLIDIYFISQRCYLIHYAGSSQLSCWLQLLHLSACRLQSAARNWLTRKRKKAFWNGIEVLLYLASRYMEYCSCSLQA